MFVDGYVVFWVGGYLNVMFLIMEVVGDVLIVGMG